MAKINLRYRQIHLDFHTSEDIPDVGADFDPDEFVATLESAHVDSITCFARCHHGWMYYDTKAFRERRHPHLVRSLLNEQIAACHARDIRAPIYTTIQWDHYTATHHPEWLCIDATGRWVGTPPFEAGFYRELCVNSPYRDFVKAHTKELLDTLPVDGFFFDIVRPVECACRFCRAKMEAAGLEPAEPDARRRFALETINEFKRDMSQFVWALNPQCSIFFNAGHIGTRHRPVAAAYSHFELETLPSGGWGYLHFPLTVRYARNLGIECLGQTGKFHTSWGDFHSFKNAAALQYECFRVLALGAKCSIGDQLHPRGQIDRHVYELVGSVYAEVEKKEPWCAGATPVAEVAVFTPEEFHGAAIGAMPPSLMGVTRMLDEGAHQFDIVDSFSDLSPYRVVVLPDNIPVSASLAQKLEAYLAGGGTLIASFESGMDAAQAGFTLKALGVALKNEGPRDLSGALVRGRHFPRADYVEYLLPGSKLSQGLPQTELAMYMKGMTVTAEPGTETLADNILPYFDRTYKRFCSHRQTPSSGQVGAPAVVQRGRAIYFAHPIFSQYNQNAPRWCKVLFLNALNLLLPEPLVCHKGPTTLQAALNAQAAQNRWVLHLLHYIPERRGQEFDVIEDVIPLHDVEISVKAPKPVQAVTCVPEGDALAFEQKDGRVVFALPKLNGHQMIALQFA